MVPAVSVQETGKGAVALVVAAVLHPTNTLYWKHQQQCVPLATRHQIPTTNTLFRESRKVANMAVHPGLTVLLSSCSLIPIWNRASLKQARTSSLSRASKGAGHLSKTKPKLGLLYAFTFK